VARITIPVEQLPAPDKNGNHNIQFRVISEDRNKASAWSTLYTIKSIGQYRPLESDVSLTIADEEVSVVWDTPTVYNYHPSLASASIEHNHSIQFKKHDTDIFIKHEYQFLDLDFLANTGNGSGSVSSLFVYATALQTDGKILIGGNFSSWNSSSARHLVRLNSDGTLDTSFSSNIGTGGGGFNSVSDLKIQSDGKIIACGSFSSWNGTSANDIIRLNSNGTLDTVFSSNVGSGANSTIETVDIQQDGKIIAAGQFNTWAGVSVGGLVRLNSDGTRDTTFSSNVGTGYLTSTNELIQRVLVQQDGKIIVAGWFDKWNGATVGGLVRLNSDGTRDTTFSSNVGTGALYVREAVIQPDGKIILSIIVGIWNGQSSSRIIRLNQDGTKDSNFYYSSTAGGPFGLALQEDGKILAGFSSTTKGVIRLNSNGTLDEYFDIHAGTNTTPNTVNSITQQPDGKIILAGSFRNFDGVVVSGIARLNNLNDRVPIFQYHERVDSDNVSIYVPPEAISVRVVGTLATHGFDRSTTSDQMVEDLSEMFLVFDTGTQLI
jgi:uncharacterized delta-60 repeat protein